MLAKKTAKRIPMVNIPIVNIPMIQVNYGIASSYDNCIEIHHKLPADLKERILNHEKKHGKGAYNIQDFKNDFQSNNSYFFKSLKFAFFNLEALIGFFPFMYSYYLKTFTWNSSAVYPFFWFGLIFSLFLFCFMLYLYLQLI